MKTLLLSADDAQTPVIAAEMIRNAQVKMKELRQVTCEYVDDSLKQTEEAVAAALAKVRDSRNQFRAMTNPQPKQPSPIIEDV